MSQKKARNPVFDRIDPSINGPRYIQVLNLVREAIESGQLPIGSRLPTNRDLAKATGVSAMTANRALDELAQLGYLRREVGRGTFVISTAPVAQRTEKPHIEIYVQLDPEAVQDDFYFGPIIRGVIDEAIRSNVTVSFRYLEERIPDSQADCMVLFAPLDRHRPAIEKLAKRRTPVVVIGSHWPDLPIPSVDCDNAAGVQRAVERLVNFGHRHIALITAIPDAPNTRDRRAGYRRGLAEAGIAYDEQLDIRLPELGEWWHEVPDAVDHVLSLPQQVTALICGGLPIARSALLHLGQRNIRVPEQLSVIGFDEDFSLYPEETAPTAITQPLHEMGVAALKFANTCIHTFPPPGNTLQLFPAGLRGNGTIGPPQQ